MPNLAVLVNQTTLFMAAPGLPENLGRKSENLTVSDVNKGHTK